MSRGRRNARDDVSMNLFPFLAVLICTMGSLIVLLVVMVQQARVRASVPAAETEIAAPAASSTLAAERAREREERAQLAQQRREEIEDYQWQAQLLRTSYDHASQQLSAQRLALSHLEDHSRELLDQAARMQAEADAIARAKESSQLDEADKQQQLTKLDTLIASATSELAKATAELSRKQKTYALIPYDGPNGTRRRPIYIECLPNVIILQPEGIKLTSNDFREPLTIANPLAAALRAKREFLLDQGLLEQGQEPYPLLVVRPNAASAYAAARGAMKAWEAEFGYELVEDKIALDYPAPDPRLTQVLQSVIEEARAKRRLIALARAVEPPRSRQSGLLRPSPNGGFEPVGGRSRAGGSGGAEFGRGMGDDGLPGDFGDEGFGDPEFGDAEFIDGDGEFDAGVSGGGKSGTGGLQGDPSGHERSGSDHLGISQPSRGGSGSERAGSERAGSEHSGSGRLRNGRSTSGRSSEGRPGDVARSDRAGDPRSLVGDNRGGSGASRFNAAATNPTASGGAGSSAAARQPGPNGAGAQRSTSGDPEGPPNGRQFQHAASSTGPARPGGGGSSTENGSGPSPTGTSGPAIGAASRQSGSAASSAGMSQLQFNSVPSLAGQRGANWALPDAVADAIAIRRPISVICNQHRLTLAPEKGTKDRLQVFTHNGDLQAVIDPFIDSVRQRLQGWGLAGRGIYWQPVLHVHVGENADDNYRQLLRLLENSGVQVTRQP